MLWYDVAAGPEHQEKLKLEEERRAAEEKYKYKRRQIRELDEDIEVNIFLFTLQITSAETYYWTKILLICLNENI